MNRRKSAKDMLNELLSILQGKDTRNNLAEEQAKATWLYTDPPGDFIIRPDRTDIYTGYPRFVINDDNAEAHRLVEDHLSPGTKIGSPILVRAHLCCCDSITGLVMTQCPFCLVDSLVPEHLSAARRRGKPPASCCPLTDDNDIHPTTTDGRLLHVNGLRMSTVVDAFQRGIWHLLQASKEPGDEQSVAALTLMRSMLIPIESAAWTMFGVQSFAAIGSHRIFFETVTRGGDYHDSLIQLRPNDSNDGWKYEHHMVYRGPKDSRQQAETEILSLMLQHASNGDAKAQPVSDEVRNFLHSSPSSLMLSENTKANIAIAGNVTAEEMAAKVSSQMRRLHVGGPKGMDESFVSPFREYSKIHARLQWGYAEGAERQPGDLFDSIDYAMERLTSN